MPTSLAFTWDIWVLGKTDEEIIANALAEAMDPDAQVTILERFSSPDGAFDVAKVEITSYD
jgi:hypothetical protein